MKSMDEKQMEKTIGRALRQLPDLPAPETLFHRVMLAVHERERKPWWQRPWLGWPPQAQIVSMAVLLAGLGALAYFLGQAWVGLSLEKGMVLEAAGLGWFNDLRNVLGTFLDAGSLVLKAGGQQILFVGGALALVAYLACVGVGTACWRVMASRA